LIEQFVRLVSWSGEVEVVVDLFVRVDCMAL